MINGIRKIVKKSAAHFNICTLILVLCIFTVLVQSPFPPYKNYTRDQNCIFSDGFGYYSYLPATFIYHDLSFSFFDTVYKKNYHSDAPQWTRAFIITLEKGVVNKYWIGVSVLLLPFFLIAHWLSLLLGLDADGYGILYQYAVLTGSLCYLYFGCRYIYKYLTSVLLLKTSISSITLFIIVFGTNLFYYAVYEPSMSHIYSFFTISAFCFYSIEYFKTGSFRHLILCAFLLVLIILVRPVNIICISFVPFLSGNRPDFVKGITRFFGFGYKLLLLIVIGIPFVLQMIIWHKQCGKWVIWSYPGESFNFSDPHFLDILFSYQKGFFVYMPVFFVALTGFFSVFKSSKYRFYSLLLSILFVIYILSSWYSWFYSACFGNRAFIDFYFVFAILIAFSLEQIYNKVLFWMLCSIYTLLIFFNHIQLYQYRHNIYHSINMSKADYWKVFLNTGKGYENLLYDWSNTEDLPRLRALKKKSFFSSFTNYESVKDFWSGNHIEERKFAISGNKVSAVGMAVPYGDGFFLSEDNITIKKNIIIETDFWVYLYNNVSAAYLIHQVTNNGNTRYHKSYKISTNNAAVKKWVAVKYLSEIAEIVPGDKLEVFIINAGNSSTYVDDFRITLSSY